MNNTCEILNCIFNGIIALFAVLALVKITFKFEWVFKIKTIKAQPIHRFIWSINKYRKELDILSKNALKALENLKEDDATLYFSQEKDQKLFKEYSHLRNYLNLSQVVLTEEEKELAKASESIELELKYFSFYKQLTKRGQKELESLEVRIFNGESLTE